MYPIVDDEYTPVEPLLFSVGIGVIRLNVYHGDEDGQLRKKHEKEEHTMQCMYPGSGRKHMEKDGR